MSMASSKSRRSGYKKVADTSSVDECLFGNNLTINHRDKTTKTILRETRDDKKRHVTGKVNRYEKPKEDDDIVISANDLLRMKHDAILLTKQERQNQDRISKEQIDKQMMAARKKREKMQAQDNKASNKPLGQQKE